MKKIKLKDNKLIQIKNISETLIEATEHFAKNLNNREFHQSIHIFSSIVEGYHAISQIFNIYNSDLVDIKNLLKKIERNLGLIANHLEQKDLGKITEIVQFSLLPNLNRLNNFLSSKNKSENVTIGIYYDKINPIDAYNKQRIDALVKEGDLQQVKLLFFSSKDVDFENKKINAYIFQNRKWEKIKSNFPDVVNNIGVSAKHQQSITERKLRRIIPFTSYGVGDKLFLPKVMVRHRHFAELLVPFKLITDEKIIYDYLKNEKKAVIKPISGARGENIFFIQKKGSRYTVSEHRQEKIYSQDRFNEWIQSKILSKKFSYIIQKYIECQTRDGKPFDIRIHMQKDREGNWSITKQYPRIGSRQSILSNISRGGRTEELKPFLEKEYGSKKGENYYISISKLSIDLTKYLDRIHNFSLDEIGLDLAIDKNGRFWLYEANNGPQSTYHEEERAINTIGYAIYIAKNGIIKHSKFHNNYSYFNAKTSNLPFAEVDNRYRIGMLKSKNDDDRLAIASAYVAHYENVQFYTFTPEDIDYSEMLIKGEFYENGKWISKIIEYPNVIYDRFRLKGITGFNDVYEELEGIPFTNEFFGNPISKLEVYNKLKSTGKLNDIIIPYKKIEKIRDIFQYIDKYGEVIIKPEIGSFARGVHYIAKQEDNNYFIAEKSIEMEYNEIALRRYLNELLDSNTFIVQRYINTRTIDGNPFDIRVHMMKDGKNEWSYVNIFPRIGVNHVASTGFFDGSYRGEFTGFIKRNFKQLEPEQVKKNIKLLTSKVTNIFTELFTNSFNEIAFDIAIDQRNNCLYLIELNVNKPGIMNYEFDIARIAIPNAIYLAAKNKNDSSL